MQQIPSKPPGSRLRDAFVAPPGMKIITADYSQIELRILAELSGDERMLEAYKQGFDGHTNTASAAFGVPLEAVDPEMRKVAKIINFATVYGGGPKAISKGLLQQINADEAEKVLESLDVKRDYSKDVYYQLAAVFIDNYFKELAGAKAWLDSMGYYALDHLYTKTPIGRRRFYVLRDYRKDDGSVDHDAMRRQASGIKRKGMNHPIQGCSADITKIAVINLGRAFAGKEGCKILLQVHDEIVTEVPEEIAEEMAVIQVEAMEEAAKVFLKSVPVHVDYNIGDKWQK
jgi:DNA polymerase-1